MKMVGFLAKHEKRILGTAFGYDRADEHQSRITEESKGDILRYLAAGKYIFGMTLAIEDESGKYISPYIVYGDDEWLWPAYLSYYIESGRLVELPGEFLEHITKNNFEFPEITIGQEETAKKFFMTLLSENNQNGQKK
jgi:hypothetical protein